MITRFNFDLTEFNSYKLDAKCAVALFPQTEEDVRYIFSNPQARNYIVLGSGFNVILSKRWYNETFVIFNSSFSTCHVDGNIIISQAGCDMLFLSKLALENSLSGLEMFYDIPSSLGGAIVMNAGASGEEIKDLVESVKYFDTFEQKIHQKKAKELDFSYRNSIFQKKENLIVLEAVLRLQRSRPKDILSKMEEIRTNRWKKQPREYPSAGSVFKRPKGMFVGPMIESLGLKGFQIGGAKVSSKHCGFIINCGQATGEDILNLINYIKEKVYQKFEIDLEIEQRII